MPEGIDTWQPWTTAAAAIAAIALASRHRSRPFGAIVALAALAGIGIGAEIVGEPGHISFGHHAVIALLISDVARHCRLPTVGGVVAVSMLTAALSEGLADDRGPADIAFVAMMWAFAASAALALRWRQAASNARDERVKTEERERLARELHDTVAHHVSAIALTAEGARGLVSSDPDMVDRSLGAINEAAVGALDEMREMVEILRDGAGASPPMRLDALADSLSSNDHPRVVVSVAPQEREPPSAVAAAVHRIAREAVTNSRRHAKDVTAVAVDVTRDSSDLVLTVIDDGRGTAMRSRDGFGVDGMVERAELLGGSCQAGPADAGGWKVEARIPVERPT